MPNADRYQFLAGAYLSATAEKKRNGDPKSALVVSPPRSFSSARITKAIRAETKERGELGAERVLPVWLPAHLTGAQKGDADNYDTGDPLQFHQNAPGHENGSRVIVAAGNRPPLEHAERFEVYRPAALALAVGARVRVTVGGKTKDGKHRLNNGTLLTVWGFTPRATSSWTATG